MADERTCRRPFARTRHGKSRALCASHFSSPRSVRQDIRDGRKHQSVRRQQARLSRRRIWRKGIRLRRQLARRPSCVERRRTCLCGQPAQRRRAGGTQERQRRARHRFPPRHAQDLEQIVAAPSMVEESPDLPAVTCRAHAGLAAACAGSTAGVHRIRSLRVKRLPAQRPARSRRRPPPPRQMQAPACIRRVIADMGHRPLSASAFSRVSCPGRYCHGASRPRCSRTMR